MADLSGTITLKDILSLSDMNDTTGIQFKQKVFSYCKENLVKLVVYLPSPYVTRMVVNEVNSGVLLDQMKNNILLQEITLSTFTSNIGGLLGLCMGLSFVSLVEVLFYVLKFIILKTKYLMQS